jgi:hypothetical protein
LAHPLRCARRLEGPLWGELLNGNPRLASGIGASRPLRRIPTIVSFLNPQPAFILVCENRSSRPLRAIPGHRQRMVEVDRKRTFALDPEPKSASQSQHPEAVRWDIPVEPTICN